jgi:hypothetical protein
MPVLNTRLWEGFGLQRGGLQIQAVVHYLTEEVRMLRRQVRSRMEKASSPCPETCRLEREKLGLSMQGCAARGGGEGRGVIWICTGPGVASSRCGNQADLSTPGNLPANRISVLKAPNVGGVREAGDQAAHLERQCEGRWCGCGRLVRDAQDDIQ